MDLLEPESTLSGQFRHLCGRGYKSVTFRSARLALGKGIAVRRPYEDSLGRKGSDRFAFPPKAVASLSQTLSAGCLLPCYPGALAPCYPITVAPWRLAALLPCHRGA